MGKLKIIAILLGLTIVSSILFSTRSFAESLEESLGSVGNSVAAFGLTVFIFIGIPALIIALIVLKIKNQITKKILKKILLGTVVLVLGLVALQIISQYAMTDEEKAVRATEREAEEARALQERIAEREKQAELNRQEELVLTDRQVADIVKQYKGKDGKGDRLVDVLATLINVAYPNENILDSPSTLVDWYAFPDLTKKQGVYKVGFIFQTYKEDTEYIWYVDTNTNRISAGNSDAKAILDLLYMFD